jgi:hypothetical protein
MFDMSDEDDQEEVTMETVRKKEKPQAEIRVYMDPPLERADGDTDKDSGKKKTIYSVILLVTHSTVPIQYSTFVILFLG